ncbi:MAG: methyltransferase [Flavobacteriia bacterium]|nr:methyltransferase [Flavobacteriia bacterium]
MKIGTDSMILGALLHKSKFKKVLDIGSGTGVLSLMYAQQNKEVDIISIEIDQLSAEELKINFLNSPFKERLHSVHGDFLTYSFETKFDFIFSNPPYFESDLLSFKKNKNRVRHNLTLPVDLMFKKIDSLLEINGFFQCIIPVHLLLKYEMEAKKVSFFINEKISIFAKENKLIRYILIFSRSQNIVIESQVVIRQDNNQYTTDYIQLTEEFHGKSL